MSRLWFFRQKKKAPNYSRAYQKQYLNASLVLLGWRRKPRRQPHAERKTENKNDAAQLPRKHTGSIPVSVSSLFSRSRARIPRLLPDRHYRVANARRVHCSVAAAKLGALETPSTNLQRCASAANRVCRFPLSWKGRETRIPHGLVSRFSKRYTLDTRHDPLCWMRRRASCSACRRPKVCGLL